MVHFYLAVAAIFAATAYIGVHTAKYSILDELIEN